MYRSFDSYEEPKAYKQVKEKAWNAIYTGHYLDIDENDLHDVLVASLAQIAYELEKLRQNEEPPMELIRYVDDDRSLAGTATWCVLVYAYHDDIQYRLFMATESGWKRDILTNIRENFFGLAPDEIPILVARSRYTFSSQQMLDYLATESGRRDLLGRYSETMAITSDDKGEKILKHIYDLTSEERAWLDRYLEGIWGKDEEYNG